MIDARWIIASVFNDLYLSGLGEIRLRQILVFNILG